MTGITLTELLPSFQQLSPQEKIKAIQILATELEKRGRGSTTIEISTSLSNETKAATYYD